MTLTAEQEPSADAALVAAYRRGDERAAEELVLRHAPALGRYLYAAGADRDEVEDLVQETLFRAFRALSGWRGGTSLRGWLFTIGANLLRDEFRRRKGRLTVVLDDGDLLDSADPHAELTAAEAQERLRRGIAALPPLQREVFLRRAQLGTGYDEIAAELGTTAGAARVHYHHAVKRLKGLVQ